MLHVLILGLILAQAPGKILVAVGKSEDTLKTASWHDLHVPDLRGAKRNFKIIAERGQQPLALRLEDQQVADLLAGQVVWLKLQDGALLVRLSYASGQSGRAW